MKHENRQAAARFVLSHVKIALLLFIPAWTLYYWQAWDVLILFFICNLALQLYIKKNDPALFKSRNTAGFMAEKDRLQKVIHSRINRSFDAMLILSAIDHHFGWSYMPNILIISGNLLIFLGFVVIFAVFRVNSFASATIEVTPEQRLISTGPYTWVRHPMYSAGLIIRCGVPLALGTWCGFLILIPSILIFAQRLIQEELFLDQKLAGYSDYKARVKYRLIPFIW